MPYISQIQRLRCVFMGVAQRTVPILRVVVILKDMLHPNYRNLCVCKMRPILCPCRMTYRVSWTFEEACMMLVQSTSCLLLLCVRVLLSGSAKTSWWYPLVASMSRLFHGLSLVFHSRRCPSCASWWIALPTVFWFTYKTSEIWKVWCLSIVYPFSYRQNFKKVETRRAELCAC